MDGTTTISASTWRTKGGRKRRMGNYAAQALRHLEKARELAQAPHVEGHHIALERELDNAIAMVMAAYFGGESPAHMPEAAEGDSKPSTGSCGTGCDKSLGSGYCEKRRFGEDGQVLYATNPLGCPAKYVHTEGEWREVKAWVAKPNEWREAPQGKPLPGLGAA